MPTMRRRAHNTTYFGIRRLFIFMADRALRKRRESFVILAFTKVANCRIYIREDHVDCATDWRSGLIADR